MRGNICRSPHPSSVANPPILRRVESQGWKAILTVLRPWGKYHGMSAIALPALERDLRAALARVARGESLLVVDEGKEIARISPPSISTTAEPTTQPLVEFFLTSPLRESGLEILRDRSSERPTVVL